MTRAKPIHPQVALGTLAVVILAACSRPGAPDRNPQPASSVSSAAAAAPPRPSATPVAKKPEPCPAPIPETTFGYCNPTPRFTSIPDCYEYAFDPLKALDPKDCAPNQMRLYVTRPQLIDELTAVLVSQAPDRLDVTLHRVDGSMGNSFEAKPGSALGTVVLKRGQPTKFVLGEALLPNEIGAREATALK